MKDVMAEPLVIIESLEKSFEHMGRTLHVLKGIEPNINAGSKYMFDFMYPEFTSYVEAGAQAMISSEVLFCRRATKIDHLNGVMRVQN